MGVCTLRDKRRAVFFDRDGVLNKAIVREGRPYPPKNLSEFTLENGADSALRSLADSVPLMFVVSNQPDVARGTQVRGNVEELNSLLAARLPITQFYVCYHDDSDKCDCRKPLPGLLLQAAEEHDVDLSRSYMVGDRWRDIAAGAAAGCTTVFIDRKYDEEMPQIRPHATVASLADAVAFILTSESNRNTNRKGVSAR